MGLGELLIRQNALLNMPRKQQSDKAVPDTVSRGFVTRYLGCLGVSDLGKLPEVLRKFNINGEAVRCITELMKSTSWDEVFMKFNLEAALLETTTKRDLQQLFSGGSNQDASPLSLYGLYNFALSINAIRTLISNDGTKSLGLLTLAKMTYLIFDVYGELTKRGIIPQDLEIEIWRTRETLIKIMEELFKRNGTITVHDKSFDANRQLR
jgi:hypothetical protein